MFGFFELLLLFLIPSRLRKAKHNRSKQMDKVMTRLRLAVIMVFMVMVFGTIGFVLIEGFSWFEGYYMTLITVSSVGFAELHPLSIQGRLFTTVLILVNLGIFAYAISTITSIFAEGGITRLINEFRMDQTIQKLRNHTIICGFGRHAAEVTWELAKQKLPFVVIDNDPAKQEKLQESQFLFVQGDATHDEVLEEAGIRFAKTLVTTLPDDAGNMFIVLSARQMNPGLHIVSRASNHADEVKILRAGADHTVVPEQIGGFYMATLVTKPELMQFFTLLSNMGPTPVGFDEILVNQLQPDLQYRTIGETEILKGVRVSLVAIRKSDGTYEFNPDMEELLTPEKHLIVLGNPDQLTLFRERLLKPEHKPVLIS